LPKRATILLILFTVTILINCKVYFSSINTLKEDWDCRLISFAVIPKGLLTQSLSNKRVAFVWLFCSSSTPESKLSSLPPNKKASHFVRGFVATLGAGLDEFAGDVMAILDAKIKNL